MVLNTFYLAIGHLLQSFFHHGLLVVLELLGVRHVFRSNTKEVSRAPADAQDEHEDDLHVVPGLNWVQTKKLLKPIVSQVATYERDSADEYDVLAVVSKLHDFILIVLGGAHDHSVSRLPLFRASNASAANEKVSLSSSSSKISSTLLFFFGSSVGFVSRDKTGDGGGGGGGGGAQAERRRST